jgi:hypothetical protein
MITIIISFMRDAEPPRARVLFVLDFCGLRDLFF